MDKQGLFTALRLVAACQLNREPSLASITANDPPPKLVGVDLNRWTIDVSDRKVTVFKRLTSKPKDGAVYG